MGVRNQKSLRRVWVAPAAALLLAMGLSSGAGAAPSPREMQAREAFAAGRYTEALDVYVKLYAGTLHPTYLRNIGRCYQNLGDLDKAISSFREYLRKARGIKLEEQDEVRGYIREMEEKRDREAKLAAEKAKAGAPPPPPPEPVKVVESPPARTPAAPTSGAALVQPPVAEVVATPHTEDAGGTAFYKKWWFWTAVGVVAIAGGVAWWTQRSSGDCLSDRVCGIRMDGLK